MEYICNPKQSSIHVEGSRVVANIDYTVKPWLKQKKKRKENEGLKILSMIYQHSYVIYNSIYNFTHIVLMNLSYLDWWYFLPPTAKDHLTESPRWDMRIPFVSCSSGLSKRLPKYTAYCFGPWLPPEVEGKLLLLKALHTSDRVWSPLSWNWPECPICVD